MASSGTIRWKKLAGHLDDLLPGWRLQITPHGRRIYFGGKKVCLPKGPHGRSDPEIELGHVRNMFRHFGKLPEARKTIPQLK